LVWIHSCAGIVTNRRPFRPLVAARVFADISKVDDEPETQRPAVLVCDGCGCELEDDARGWTAHLAREEDDSIIVTVFCPNCSIEFL
jgi:hypothetical protein